MQDCSLASGLSNFYIRQTPQRSHIQNCNTQQPKSKQVSQSVVTWTLCSMECTMTVFWKLQN